MILEVTARVNNGLCGGCKRDHDRETFNATVRGWFADPKTLPDVGNSALIAMALPSLRSKEKSAMFSP